MWSTAQSEPPTESGPLATNVAFVPTDAPFPPLCFVDESNDSVWTLPLNERPSHVHSANRKSFCATSPVHCVVPGSTMPPLPEQKSPPPAVAGPFPGAPAAGPCAPKPVPDPGPGAASPTSAVDPQP